MLVVALPPFDRLSGETGAALLIVAPMIAGQALLDLFLAATRWKHRMRYEVVGRSIVEPYAAMATAAAAWFAGFQEIGLLVSYWAGTLMALAYAIWGTHLSFGSFALGAYRLGRDRVKAIFREGAVPMANDLVSGLFARLDLYLVGLFLGESPGGHLRHGAPDQDTYPSGPAELRRAADSDRRQDSRRQRHPHEPGSLLASAARLILAIQLAILVGLAVIGLPAVAMARPRIRRSVTWPCCCSPPRRRSRVRSASPT